jgi:hypothetical protein
MTIGNKFTVLSTDEKWRTGYFLHSSPKVLLSKAAWMVNEQNQKANEIIAADFMKSGAIISNKRKALTTK